MNLSLSIADFEPGYMAGLHAVSVQVSIPFQPESFFVFQRHCPESVIKNVDHPLFVAWEVKYRHRNYLLGNLMALEVRNKELPSYENSRSQGRGKRNMLCLFGYGKLIIVWVLCHYSLYELFQFGILLFFCCFGDTKEFLERYTLCPCIQENAEKLRQIADKSYGEEQGCPCETSLLISQVGSFLLAGCSAEKRGPPEGGMESLWPSRWLLSLAALS